MSIRSIDQIAYVPAAVQATDGRKMLHRAVVASTSLIAMSAALGWSDPALATGTCGAPNGHGVVNCNATSYPGGIEYVGIDSVDDLTVNVGSFAGQNGAVTVDGIYVSNFSDSPTDATESVYVGGNVSVSAKYGSAYGIYVAAYGQNRANASVRNLGTVTGGIVVESVGFGDTGTSYVYNGGTVDKIIAQSVGTNAVTTIVNDGAIEPGSISEIVLAHAYGYDSAIATITNAGSVTSGEEGLNASAFTYRNDGYATATAIVTNTGPITTSNGSGITAFSETRVSTFGGQYSAGYAYTTVDNSGAITTAGQFGMGILGNSTSYVGVASRFVPYYGTAAATTTIINSGEIATSGYDPGSSPNSGIYGQARAIAEGLLGARSTAIVSIDNSNTISTSGDYAAAIVEYAIGSSLAYGYATGSAYVAINNSGSLSTTGLRAAGISGQARGRGQGNFGAYGYATVNITNSGAISTTGDGFGTGYGSTGISAKATAYGYGGSRGIGYSSVAIDNSGDITTTGAYSDGIYGLSYAFGVGLEAGAYSNLSITNSGTITTTSGYYAAGIVEASIASAQGVFNYTASRGSIVNTGDINTQGNDSEGLYVTAVAQSGSPAAINYTSQGHAYAFANVTNSGALTTSGLISTGIVASSFAGSYAYFQGNSEAITQVANSGAIAADGFLGAGILSLANAASFVSFGSAYASNATAIDAVNNTGNIEATYAGTGIQAKSYAVALGGATATSTAYMGLYNSGDINATTGILVNSLANLATYGAGTGLAVTNVTNVGDITSYAPSISAVAYDNVYAAYAYGTAAVTVNNSGALKSTGAREPGIYAAAVSNVYSPAGKTYSTAYAYSTVNNTGAIVTSGYLSSGIRAVSLAEGGATSPVGGPYYGTAIAITTVNNSGAISTSGDGYLFTGATGISAYATAFTYGLLGARGTATVNVTNTGAISTSGSYGWGIAAEGSSDSIAVGYATGAVYVNVRNAGAITTSGDYAFGLAAGAISYARSYFGAYAYATTSVVNTGAITTSGFASSGIDAAASGFALSPNSGTASAYTSLSVTNSGAITTSGDFAKGILAYAYSFASGRSSTPYSNATVTNFGAVETSGYNSTGVYAASVSYAGPVFGYSAARANVTNYGPVTTSGDQAAGIFVAAVSQSAAPYTLLYSGQGHTYASAAATNSGAITTSGDYSIGIDAQSVASASSYFASHSYAQTSVTNSGDITTSGILSEGIDAASTAIANVYPTTNYASVARATTTVNNSGGTMLVSGPGTIGIAAVSHAQAIGSASAEADAVTNVSNGGNVYVLYGPGIFGSSAAYANGLGAANASAVTTVGNTGVVVTYGTGSVGILATASAISSGTSNAAANVSNAGYVLNYGAGGIGLKAVADNVTVTTTGGLIEGGYGAGAAGVYTSANAATINNGGSIGSHNDAAIVMNGLTSNTLNNTGTLTGYVTMHSADNSFYNSGAWFARGGNSDFAHTAGGSSILVNTGTVVAVGDQTLTHLDKFENAGLVDLTLGSSVGHGSRPDFETLEVSGDFVGDDGSTLAVDSNGTTVADVLKVDHGVSGHTEVAVNFIGAPGLTSGNGILVVDAGHTTGASNFELLGNDPSGSLVDGAFQYNLVFEPGSGSAGEWFLQSHVFPGTFQFGQIQSEALVANEQINVSLFELLDRAEASATQEASNDQPVQVASNDPNMVPSPENGGFLSGWAQGKIATLTVDPSGAGGLADYRLHVNGGQFGLDHSWQAHGQTFVLGGYVAPYTAHAGFKNQGGAEMRLSGTGYAGYGLWLDGPWRVGVLVNYTDNRTIFTDQIGTNAKTNPNIFGISAAGRYTMALDGFNFAPQAEFNYDSVKRATFFDGVGDRVSIGSTHETWLRLNGKFSTTVDTENGTVFEPFATIGFIWRGGTSTDIDIGNFSTQTDINGWSGDFAAGFSANISDNLSLFAQGDYQAGSQVKGWSGSVGIRYTP